MMAATITCAGLIASTSCSWPLRRRTPNRAEKTVRATCNGPALRGGCLGSAIHEPDFTGFGAATVPATSKNV